MNRWAGGAVLALQGFHVAFLLLHDWIPLGTLKYFNEPRYPAWVRNWLFVSYGLLFAGEIQAWWLPYLWRNEPERAARYQVMFGKTHTFLPVRNGVAPNTLHVLLHAATLALLALLPLL